jgi:hypothetical protein
MSAHTARRRWVAKFAAVVLAAVLATPVFGASLTSKGDCDWEAGVFTLTLTAPLPISDATPPKRRYLAEQETQRHVQEEFVRRAGELPVASGKTLAELMAADPLIEAGVAQLSEKLKFVSSRVDDGYTTLEMVWSVGLWDGLAPVLAEAAQPNPVPSLIRWAPSRDFSGIVIFAMGDLPWLTTGQTARWAPSLSFRLLNPRGETMFDPTMLVPEFAAKWGQAGVSLGKFNEQRWVDRIGNDPLRIVARGVWGAHPGDLVLAEGDWDRLLSRDANRQLLAEGRVLILYGPFPDYTNHPNPDSAIDEEQPPIQTISEPPAPSGPPANGNRE